MNKEQQIADTILLVRPANFGFNKETAENNAFQINDLELSKKEISRLARDEFDSFAGTLQAAGIKCLIIEDTDAPVKTDAVFPNNWFSTHYPNILIQYPLFSPNRRAERRADIISILEECYRIKQDTSFLKYESEGNFLESTGSMILDRPNKIIYACLSDRTDQNLLEIFAVKMGYEVISFHAVDHDGVPYYHTNVIMTLGRDLAVICLESIEDLEERAILVNSLNKTEKAILDISRNQVLQFAGNMLEVFGKNRQSHMIMSTQAFKSLTPSQVNLIEKSCHIVHSPLDIIEKYGGGSARCMIAEIFLENLGRSNCV